MFEPINNKKEQQLNKEHKETNNDKIDQRSITILKNVKNKQKKKCGDVGRRVGLDFLKWWQGRVGRPGAARINIKFCKLVGSGGICLRPCLWGWLSGSQPISQLESPQALHLAIGPSSHLILQHTR